MSDSTPHSSHIPAEGPAVGQDEWVARHAERRLMPGGPLGTIEQRLRRVPWWAWLILFLAAFSLLPVLEQSGYVRKELGLWLRTRPRVLSGECQEPSRQPAWRIPSSRRASLMSFILRS